jgi:hypothetical protein
MTKILLVHCSILNNLVANISNILMEIKLNYPSCKTVTIVSLVEELETRKYNGRNVNLQ